MQNPSIVVLLLAALCLAPALSGCDGGGASCADICAKVVECDPQMALSECETGCNQMRPAIRPEVFNSMANCYLDTPCATLVQQEDLCMSQAAALVPPGTGDRFVGAMCDKIVECDQTGSMTKEQCRTMMAQDNDYEMLGMFNDSVIDCVARCMGDLPCVDLGSSQALAGCFDRCGLGSMIFTSDSPQP